MNRVLLMLMLWAVMLAGCGSASGGEEKGNIQTLPVKEYAQALAMSQGAVLIDVRTPEEYATGHLKGAENMDFRGSNFLAGFSKLDKSKPVFIYCLSGGRSGAAAKQLADLGFKQVYNLEGGIMKWKAASKEVETAASGNTGRGMTTDDLAKAVSKEKYVLVDFGAKWCKPCQALAPELDKFAESRTASLELLKIDADANEGLMQAKGISGIPYLELYKGGQLVWTHSGYIEIADLAKQTGL